VWKTENKCGFEENRIQKLWMIVSVERFAARAMGSKIFKMALDNRMDLCSSSRAESRDIQAV